MNNGLGGDLFPFVSGYRCEEWTGDCLEALDDPIDDLVEAVGVYLCVGRIWHLRPGTAAERDDGQRAHRFGFGRSKIADHTVGVFDLGEAGGDDGVIDGEAEGFLKKPLAVTAAKLVVVGAEAALEEASESAEKSALKGVLTGVLEVGGREDEAAVGFSVDDGCEGFALKSRLRDQGGHEVGQHTEDAAVFVEIVIGIVEVMGGKGSDGQHRCVGLVLSGRVVQAVATGSWLSERIVDGEVVVGELERVVVGDSAIDVESGESPCRSKGPGGVDLLWEWIADGCPGRVQVVGYRAIDLARCEEEWEGPGSFCGLLEQWPCVFIGTDWEGLREREERLACGRAYGLELQAIGVIADGFLGGTCSVST